MVQVSGLTPSARACRHPDHPVVAGGGFFMFFPLTLPCFSYALLVIIKSVACYVNCVPLYVCVFFFKAFRFLRIAEETHSHENSWI